MRVGRGVWGDLMSGNRYCIWCCYLVSAPLSETQRFRMVLVCFRAVWGTIVQQVVQQSCGDVSLERRIVAIAGDVSSRAATINEAVQPQSPVEGRLANQPLPVPPRTSKSTQWFLAHPSVGIQAPPDPRPYPKNKGVSAAPLPGVPVYDAGFARSALWHSGGHDWDSILPRVDGGYEPDSGR
jgi:hypothetical protein